MWTTNEKRPRSRRRCFLAFCPYAWQAGPWSDCSATCGPGRVTRNVTCQRVTPEGWRAGEAATGTALCDAQEAQEVERHCNLRDCEGRRGGGGVWEVGEFGECRYNSPAGDCGEGERHRSVRCRSAKTGGSNDDCPPDGGPPASDACAPRRCLAGSCAELKRQTRVKLDGEYSLRIDGRMAQVYCFAMRSRSPREFISVGGAGGRAKNFAIMHNIALATHHHQEQPVRCPTPERLAGLSRAACSRPNADCRLVRDTKSFVTGMSSFRKYRLLMEPILHIAATDDTFAISWKSFVPAGKAGDCFSDLPDCALGRFTIDLTGTSFALDDGNIWIGENVTTNVIKRIDSRQVQGTCGGQCGFCKLLDDKLLIKIASSVPVV